MFKFNFRKLLFLGLIAGIAITGCSKDDDNDVDPKATGTIEGFSIGLSSYNGRIINLSWDNDTALTNPSYDIYRAEGDGEFSRRERGVKNAYYTDRGTEFSTNYKYYIKYEEKVSETLKIETVSQFLPYLSGKGARYNGEGASATIEYLNISWRVGSSEATDDIDRFEIYRNEQHIDTETYTSSFSNEYNYKDEGYNFQFGEDYSYKVIAFTNVGTQYESLEAIITPQRPDEQNHETPDAPEIVKVRSDKETQMIDVFITDVSERGNDFIAYYIGSEELDIYWENMVRTDELSTDEDGNRIIRLNASNITIPSGKTIWLKSKVKIEIVDIQLWSEWSDWNTTVIFY